MSVRKKRRQKEQQRTKHSCFTHSLTHACRPHHDQSHADIHSLSVLARSSGDNAGGDDEVIVVVDVALTGGGEGVRAVTAEAKPILLAISCAARRGLLDEEVEAEGMGEGEEEGEAEGADENLDT